MKTSSQIDIDKVELEDKTIFRENESFDEFDEEDAFGLSRESGEKPEKKGLKSLFKRKKKTTEIEDDVEEEVAEDEVELEIKLPRMRTLRIIYAVLAFIAASIVVYIGVTIAYHVIMDKRIQTAQESLVNMDHTEVSLEDELVQIQSEASGEGELFYADFLLPESSESYLSRADLEGLSKAQLEIARNEIYARHGLLFADAYLATYFSSCSWYHGSVTSVTSDMLNDYEKANISLILELENE